MYRPFVTCDDPKGVVECGTIRKSISCVPKREDKVQKGRADKHSRTSTGMAFKVGKQEDVVSRGAIQEYQNPSFQLLEISRGAQKLNQMIDAWSRGSTYGGGGQPKDIAKDLLRGALDLQESLAMLGKLQEASHHLKKKHKEKADKGRVYELGSEAASSLRFQDRSYQMGLQQPRLSADASSMDSSIDELNKAIRDGLAKQNLLPTAGYQQRIYTRRQESTSDIASTSSSEPSRDQFNDSLAYTDSSSSSSRVSQIKKKGPNLIARLMGLEEIPSKAFQQPVAHAQKQVQAERISSPTRPAFEIETPNLRKPYHVLENMDPDRRTLKEVLDTMHYKGLLKSPSVKLLKSRSYQSGDHVYSDHRPVEDVPPIVVIKPMRAFVRGPDDSNGLPGLEEEILNKKTMQRKMEVQEEHVAPLRGSRDSIPSASRMQLRVDAPNAPVKRQNEGAKDGRYKVGDVEEKEVRTVDEKELAADINKQRKLEAEEVSVKRQVHEGGTMDQTVVARRAEEKGVATKLKNSSKAKASDQQQKVDKIADKKMDKIHKAATTVKRARETEAEKPKIASRSVEREAEKPRNASSSQDQSKLTSRKPKNGSAKPKNGSASAIAQKQVQKEQSANLKTSSVQTTRSRTRDSNCRRRKETYGGTEATKGPIAKSAQREDHKGINRASDNESAGEESIASAQNKLSEENANASQVKVEGLEDEGSRSPECNVILLESECRQKDVKRPEESGDRISCCGGEDTSRKAENPLKALLLSNLSFVNYADQLFYLEHGTCVVPPLSDNEDPKASEAKLLLDYAKEFAERRSLPDSQALHPLVPAYRSYLRISLSLDQLVEEICNGIDTLKSYSQAAVAADSLSADTLYATLEGDLGCNGILSGTWKMGWRRGFSCDDVEQTIVDLENLLLCDLMNEVLL